MLQHGILDFRRKQILAAANDHFLKSPGDGNKAAAVHAAEIAGMQPIVGVDRRRRGSGVVVIAGHHMITPGADFALPADWHHSATGKVKDRDVHVGRGLSNRQGQIIVAAVGP